jgi:tetratricopeptide (TPR) repeat protein
MPKYDVVRVFIASPGDLSEERKSFPMMLDHINKTTAHCLNYHFEPLGWEDTLPNWGRPQELINRDVEECDIFLMLLWRRWGTRSGKYSSGTEEEFTIAHEKYKTTGNPDLLLCFRSIPEDMMADPGEQLKRVIRFRARIEKQRICLFKSYSTPDQFKDLLVEHLGRWLDKKRYGREFASESEKMTIKTSLESEQTILELQKQLQTAADRLATAQAKLRKEAIGYAVQAMRLIDDGNFTLAEERFAKSIDLYEEPEVLNTFGNFLLQIGSIDRAREKFERLVNLSTHNKDNCGLAMAFHSLGLVYDIRSDWERAQEMYERALEIEHELGRKEWITRSYTKIAEILRKRGDLNKAEEMLTKALVINDQAYDGQGAADTYLCLGLIYRTRGDLNKAEEMYLKALSIYQDLSNRQGIAKSYSELGIIHWRRADLDQAETMHREALEIDEGLGSKERIASGYNNLGLIYWEREKLNDSKEMFRRPLEISKELGNKEDMALAYGNLGNVYLDEGDLTQAELSYQESLQIDRDLGRKEGIANTYRNLGVVYESKGDLDKAKTMWEESIKLFKEFQDEATVEEIKSMLESIENPTSNLRTPRDVN